MTSCLRVHPTYIYYAGLVKGRLQFEVSSEKFPNDYELIILDENRMLKGVLVHIDKILSMSIEELDSFILDAEFGVNSLNNTVALDFLKGLLAGKEIHSHFGGVGGGSYKIGGFNHKLKGYNLVKSQVKKKINEHKETETLKRQEMAAAAFFAELEANIQDSQDKKDYEEKRRLYRFLKRYYWKWLYKKNAIANLESELRSYLLNLEIEEERMNMLRLSIFHCGFKSEFEEIINEAIEECINSLFSGPYMR